MRTHPQVVFSRTLAMRDNPLEHFAQTLLITIVIAAHALAIPHLAAAQPDPSWVNGAILVGSVNDCSGPGNQTNAAEAVLCQSYNADLYESLDYTGDNPEPADDTDIQTFSVGADGNFLYVEWDLLASWDERTTPGHQYVVEVDVDPLTEQRGDDYLAIYGKNEFNTSSWVDAYEQGGFEAYADNGDSGTANDVGGTNPATGDPNCVDCPAPNPNTQDGYTGKICDAEDRVYARIVDGNVQLAVRWTCLEDSSNNVLGNPPAAFRVRGWSSQSSTIEKDKLYWHDENLPADIAGENFDNVDWFVAGASIATPTNTPMPTSVRSPTSTRGPQVGCVGDCNGRGNPRISDIILGVNIALNRTAVAACPSFDPNGNGRVEINELVQAVSNALRGCSPA